MIFFWSLCILLTPFQIFGSSNWDQVVREAYGHSEAIQTLEKKWEKSQSQKSEFYGTFFPQLRLLGSVDQGQYELSGEGASTSSGKLNVKQPLFQGLGEYAKLRALEKSVMIAELQILEGKLNLAMELSQHFLKILSSQIDLANVEKKRGNLQKRTLEIGRRVKIGKSRQADLLFSQAQFEEMRAEQIEVEMSRSTFQNEFERLYFNQNRVQVWDSLESSGSLLAESQLLKDIENHPSLALVQLEIEQVSDEIEVAKSGHWPTFDLEGNYYWHRKSPTDGYQWDVVLNLSLPLYQGGQVDEKIRQQVLNRGIKESELRSLRVELETTIRSYFARWNGLQKKNLVLKKAVELSERSLSLQTKEFAMGLTSYLDVVQAEKSFWELKRNWDLARLEARSAQLYLLIFSGKYSSNGDRAN